MNKEQDVIVQGNTLIHDWMGKKRMKGGFSGWWVGAEKPQDLKYHSDWSWQIPVWGKAALAVKSLIPEIKNVDENRKWYLKIVDAYELAVYMNKPEDGQKLIVELIIFYNTNKQEG